MSLEIAKCADCKDEELEPDQIMDASDKCYYCQKGICEDHIGLWNGENCCQACQMKFRGVDDT